MQKNAKNMKKYSIKPCILKIWCYNTVIKQEENIMKKFTKIIALVLALVCICTAFAACGGNKDDGNTTKAPAVG